MATSALATQPGGSPWSSMGPSPPPQSHIYQQSIASPYYGYSLQPKNHVDLTRERLIAVLNHFSHLLANAFNNRPFRLVVHGGACMLLHPGVCALSLEQQHYLPHLPHRNKTRDVDIIHRSFVTEMAQLGITNAAEKLKGCILATAQQFGLGADWMNSDADIALPMATAPSGTTFDPIYTAAVQPNNIELHTIYRSPNGMLTLISVTPFWAVALKLVRYSAQDAADICLLLRNGTKLSNTNWTADILRDWLFTNCWPMGYQHYDRMRLRNINQRIEHALQTLAEWSTNESQRAQPTHPTQSTMAAAFTSVNVAPTPINRGITPLAAMGGGGEILGGENATEGGWKPSWPSASGPWHPESMNDRRRSQSRSAHPSPTTPPGDVVSDAFHDPYDFGVVPHDQDAASAARKAKKKARAEKKKGKSSSAPASASSSVPYLSPPPYSGAAPPIYGSPYDQASGYISDKKATGLASLNDMAHALALEQQVGHMLASPPFTAPAPVDWRRPEKMKKSKSKDKDKDKKKREKEKERKKSRKEKQTSPQWEAFPPPPIVPFEDVIDPDSEEDGSDYQSSDDSEDDRKNMRESLMHRNSWVAPPYTSPQHSPPKPNPPPPPPTWPQPGSGPPHQNHTYSHPAQTTQNAQSPFIPPTYTTRPMQHFYGSNGPPSQPSHVPFAPPQAPQPQSNHKRSPLGMSHTWHASTYPGMSGAGPAPSMAMPSVTPRAPANTPHHPQIHYPNPLRDIQNIASTSGSKSAHHQNSSSMSMSMLGLSSGPPGNQRKEKDVEPFIPPGPADIFMPNYPPPRMPY